MRACARANQSVTRSKRFGDFAGEVREDDVGAGPLDREQVLERDRGAVEPAELGRGLHHRVLTAHVIRRDRHVERGAHVGDHVEIRERGLHHHHVGALVDVERDFGDRLAAVRGVHLVAAPVAELRRALGGVAERTVERAARTWPRRRGSPSSRGRSRRARRGSRRPGRPSSRSARSRRRRRRPARSRCSRSGRAWRRCRRRRRGEHAAVAVVGVLVEAVVGHQHERVADFVAQVAQRDLHDAVAASACEPRASLCAGIPNSMTAGMPRSASGRTSLRRLSCVCWTTPGIEHDRLGRVDALLHEQRARRGRRRRPGSRRPGGERGRAAQPTQPAVGECHGAQAYRRRAASKAPRSDAVNRVRVGLGVDAQTAVACGLRSSPDRSRRRAAAGREARRSRRRSS